jgi:RNA polymerase sigma-70 factor (ECF subfamily)
MTDAEDIELIVLYRKGEVAALEQLVEKYRRPLFGFIVNMMGTAGEADEVFQEVWLRVIRKIDLYRQKNFLGWIVRIARNIVIDRARRDKPAVSLDQERNEGYSLGETLPGSEPGPMARVEAGDLGKRIAAAVADLPAEQREVFLMRTETGLAFKEIAKAQKVSINTALARMQYALQKLRTVLKDDYRNLER